MLNVNSVTQNLHQVIAGERLAEMPEPFTTDRGNSNLKHEAVVQAQLAISYELRTANLLTYFGIIDRKDSNPELWHELAEQIEARLGVANG